MRFVCDRCKSKYSISDEKVRGKVLKIRCKRCNHIIEVRDPAAVHAAAAAFGPVGLTPATDRHRSDMPEERTQVSSPGLLDELRRTASNLALQPSAEPVLSEWYIAIDDEPQGPVTKEEIRGHVAAGRVGSESLVWREGFDDWRPLREVSELKDLLRGSRALAAVAAPPRPRGASRTPTTRQSPGMAEVIPLRPSPDAFADPFHGPESNRSTLEKLPPHHSPPPPPAAALAVAPAGRVASPLRGRDVGRLGARHTTGSLAEPLPTPEERAAPTYPAPPPPSMDHGRLASAPLPPPPPGSAASLSGLISAPPPPFDALDSEGSFSFAIPPPPPPDALVPAAEARGPTPSMLPAVRAATAGRRRALLFLGVAAAVMLGVGGAVVLVKVLGGQPPPAVASEGPTNVQPLVDPGPTKAASDPVIASLRGGPEEPPPVDEPDAGSDGSPSKGGRVVRPGSGAPPPASKGKTLTEEERRLLEQAKALGSTGPVAAKTKSGEVGEAAAARRGEPLTSAQVRATVGKNMSSIQNCYEREMRGSTMQRDLRVLVYMRIGTSGTVRTATIRTATVRGSALGSCIESSVRRWRFPNATGETEVETPFVLTPRQ